MLQLSHSKYPNILPVIGLFASLTFPIRESIAAELTNQGAATNVSPLKEKVGAPKTLTEGSFVSNLSGSLVVSGAILGSTAAAIYALQRYQSKKRNVDAENGVQIVTPQSLIDDIGGNQHAREALKQIAHQWLEAVKGRGLGSFPRRVLIVAPEGSGKSLAAEGLVAATGFSSFVRLNAADLLAPRGGRKPAEILFEAIRAAKALQESLPHERRRIHKAYAVLVIEGVDTIGFDGVSDTRNSDVQPLQQILAQLQSLFRDGNRDADGILLVCTAKNVDELDAEFTSIFEQSVPIYSSSTLNQRSDLISALITRLQREWQSFPYKISFPDQDSLHQLAVLIDGLSGEQVKRILLNGADSAFARTNGKEHVVVTLPDLIDAFADIKLGLKSGEVYSSEQLHAMKLHELAHICVLKALGIPFPYLSMVPRGDGAARVQADLSGKLAWPSSKADLCAASFAIIAGRAAEGVYLGSLNTTRGAQKDLDDLIKVGKLLAEHGFIDNTIYPNASRLSHAHYTDLRKMLSGFMEKTIQAVALAFEATFEKEEFIAIADRMPNIVDDTEHLYGPALEAFIQDLLPQDKIDKLKECLLAEMNKL